MTLIIFTCPVAGAIYFLFKMEQEAADQIKIRIQKLYQELQYLNTHNGSKQEKKILLNLIAETERTYQYLMYIDSSQPHPPPPPPTV